MPPAARKTDPTVHGGMIVEGSPNVTIGYLPAARLLDKHVCPIHGPGPITQSSLTVYINGVGAARQTDACTCMVPSKGAGEGGKEKGEPVKFAIGPEKKWGEKGKEWEKDKKDPWKELPSSKPEPKLTAELSKEFGKFGNVTEAEDKAGYVKGGVYEGKGQAKLGYEGELSNLKNAKAEASAKYEIEGSALKAKGSVGDVESGSWAQGGAEAKLLTAKAGASGGAYFEAKDGKIEKAYVGGEAGAGGSVVEGKLEGKTKAIKLPFINWGISFNGEVSGALLTAEAKASAMAGYKEGKWTFGFGAKVGAALAGLGFKFGFSIEKIEPPAPPAPAPGVPGFAGIDPIAMGCMTVLVGGMPPPYVPGPPKKPDPPQIGPQEICVACLLKAAQSGNGVLGMSNPPGL